MPRDASSKVLVVGGGIGGLTLAAALGQRNIETHLIERAPAWGAVGAGIGVGVNAVLMLRKIGAGDLVLQRGCPSLYWDLTDATGRLLTRFDYHQFQNKLGATMACIHRADLHEILLGRATEASIRLGTTLASIDQDESGVDVRFSDGREDRFDLVVGADGIRSQVRDLVFGAAKLRFAGYSSRRFVVDRPPGIDRVIEMWGRGLRVGLCPIDSHRLYCYTTSTSKQGDDDPVEDRVERYKHQFSVFGGHAPAVFAQLNSPEEVFSTDILEVRDQPWKIGRVALIGDAAHAMTPDLGQGGATAIGDALALADSVGNSASVREALDTFTTRRVQLATNVQSRSRTFGRVGQFRNPVACTVRNAAVRTIASRRMAKLITPKNPKALAATQRSAVSKGH